MHGKFSDIPFFLLTKYFGLLNTLDSAALNQNFSYLIGPRTTIVTKGAPVQEMFVKDNEVGYRPVWLNPVSNTDNEFTFLKTNIIGAQSSTYTQIEDESYSFKVYDITEEADFIEDGDEIYFRKDSPFYSWIKDQASTYLLDKTDQEFVLRNYVNTDKDFIFFGKIFSKSYNGKIYGIDYYNIKNFMVDIVPEHQRTNNFKEFVSLYGDYIFNEGYSLQKDIFSLIDPFTINEKYLNHLTSICGIEIDDLDLDSINKRNLAHELINLLKSKGTLLALKYLWKLVTNNNLNILNFYEVWHDKSLTGFIPLVSREEIPWYGYYGIDKAASTDYYKTWIEKYHNFEYPKTLDVKTLATQYKVEVDLTREPIHQTEIFNKSLADKIYKYWEIFRPINRVADYNLFVSPITDLSTREILLYSEEKPAFLNSKSYVKNVALPNTAITIFKLDASGGFEYIVNHNLNSKNVLVQIYTFELKLLNPESIEYIDENNLKVKIRYSGTLFALVRRPMFRSARPEGQMESLLGTQFYISNFVDENGELAQPNEFKIFDEYNYYITPDSVFGMFSKYSYVHQQGMNSKFWSINHSLNSNVFVNAFASDGSKMFPKDVSIINQNQLSVEFENPTTGHVVVTTSNEDNIFFSSGAVTTWNVNHDLNAELLNVIVYDTNGNEIVPAHIRFIDLNTVRIELESPEIMFAVIKIADNEDANKFKWTISHNINIKEIFTQFANSEEMVLIPKAVELTDFNLMRTSISGGISLMSKYDYLHVAAVASDIWEVNHNFGYSGVLVNTYNNNNEKIYPKKIELISNTTTRVTFDSPVDGYAVLVSIGSIFFTEIMDATSVIFSNVSRTESFETTITELWTDDNYVYFRLDVPKDLELNINRIEILSSDDEVLFESNCSNIFKSKNFTASVLYRIYKGKI